MVKLMYLKMVGDMRKSVAAYLICILVVGVGFCGYCVLSVAADHLTASQKALYESSAFADGFAEVHEAPDAMSRRLEQIPGIGQAGGRIVKEVRLADTGDEEAYLLLISYEPGGLDVPMLFQGSDALQGKRQAVVGNAFLNARGLEPGGQASDFDFRKGSGTGDYRGRHISGEYLYCKKYRGNDSGSGDL